MARPPPSRDPLRIDIPGRGRLRLRHLVLDLNGTLAVDGRVPQPVRRRVARLAAVLQIRVLTADTFGTAEAEVRGLPVRLERVSDGRDKERLLRSLGPSAVAAVGNGANDVAMLRRAALSIAVAGREGMAAALWTAADVLVWSVEDGLDLLLEPRRLVATLRR